MTPRRKTGQESIPVRITLPDGRQRNGWHEPWRRLVVWKELAPAGDEDEWGQPEEWYWSHAHESEVDFEVVAADA